MRLMRILCLAIVIAAPYVALAHGPQIQITGDTGKIVTRTLLLDAPFGDVAAEKSVYVMPLKENLGVWYTRPNGAINDVTNLPAFYSGPGIAYGSAYDPANPTDVDFAVGTQIRLAFLDGLMLWNGAAFQDAGVTELEAFRGSFTVPSATARSSDAGPFASIAYDAVNYALEGSDVHNTTRFRLLGDGASPTSTSADGVYLAKLQFTTNQTDMVDSDPFYFVMHKNASRSAVDAAVASLGVAPNLVQFVPEPASSGLVACGMLMALTPWRRRRRLSGT
jgi:hypothetical protein